MKEELVCTKCGAKINKTSNFCIECGAPVEKNGKIICPNCGKEIPNTAKFCSDCGHSFVVEKKVSAKDIPWDFDSKLIFITFMLCAVFGTYLFMSSGFMSWLFSMENGRIFGVLSGIIGALIIFVFNKKEKLDVKAEFENLKKMKLTLNLAGLVFLVAGILIILNLGPATRHADYYAMPGLILVCSFIGFIGLIILYNFEKLKTSINVVAQVICIIASIICFGASAILNSQGNEMNSSYESQFTSIWEHGRANPGNEYLEYSKYALYAGIAFLVGFFIIRTSKVKENEIANMVIVIIGVLGLLLVGVLTISAL